MRSREAGFSFSATDLSNSLACHHRTGLEMAAAAGKLRKPKFADPQLEALFARGLAHEREYVASLGSGGRRLVDLGEVKDHGQASARTLDAMCEGADAIVQAALSNGSWQGRPDVLIKVAAPSRFGAWSYEAEDTKLARETRAGAILQLGLYCELLEGAQGSRPEHFRIITPYAAHEFRVDDFAAYFRWVRAGLEATGREDAEAVAAESYPEPCDHCDICPWSSRCSARRRADDHLSLVAGISRVQRRELEGRGVGTLTALAGLPLPISFKPKRGAAETYTRVREQARLQVASRDKDIVFELLPIAPAEGFCRLPEPTPGDLYLDLEGARFAGEIGSGGREYLFGLVALDVRAGPVYRARWAATPEAEKAAFEATVDFIQQTRAAHPGMHVFHYAPYEPSAFKRLAGRYATREQEIDALLRAGAFIDLFAIVRQSLRAGVERYSIKDLEPLYRYSRAVDLKDAGRHRQAVELALEFDGLSDLEPAVCASVEGYNRDDCLSALRLREWLETLRAGLVAKGAELPRPALKSGDPSKALDEREQKVAALREKLLSVDDRPRYLLAYLLDWHRREDKAVWWDYFRLCDLSDEELLDERDAVADLAYVKDVEQVKKSVVMRFSFPAQELEIRPGNELKLQDRVTWGKVVAVDRDRWTIDVKVGPSKRNLRPRSAFRHTWINPEMMENTIFAIGEGVVAGTADPLAMELLCARPPKTRVATELDEAVLAIQGPPGSGKTYTGGGMICDLVSAGRRVGIAATSHKVIRNLLNAVAHEAAKRRIVVKLAHKGGADDDADEDGFSTPISTDDNDVALALLESGKADVLGGTAFMWSRPEFRKKVDVLFIDEAGQMSLANALAVTAATKNLVLLGDPQQLEQPQKGVHPEGVDVSALQHMLGDHKTMPEDRGVFLPETWRFGSAICAFTSEVFYEGKLRPTREKDLEALRLVDGPLDGAGLFIVEVPHDGNRNASDEEVGAATRIVDRLLAPGSHWVDEKGISAQLEVSDILVVSPYNAQVTRLAERLPVEVGTVDKFQGRQAPVVIYSMATSRPEDAPRGMEFLYSLNRLNVATSRARCAAIVVASPRLFEPECKSPRQMQLASALCRFREMAKTIPWR